MELLTNVEQIYSRQQFVRMMPKINAKQPNNDKKNHLKLKKNKQTRLVK